MKRITLIGTVRPFGNKGDEAIYKASIKLIRDQYPNCKLFLAPSGFKIKFPDLLQFLESKRLVNGILPHPLAFTNAIFQELFHIQPPAKSLLRLMKFCSYNFSPYVPSLTKYVAHWKKLDFIREYEDTDLFIILGHPIEKIGLPTYLVSYFFPKITLKKPSVAFPLSISLLKFSKSVFIDKVIRNYIRMLLERMDAVLFRETKSMKYFLEDMQANANALLSADTAFLLESSTFTSLSNKLAKQDVFLEKPCVAVCLRQDYFRQYRKRFNEGSGFFIRGMAAFLDGLIEKYSLNVLFVPTAPDSGDYEISRQTFKLLKNQTKAQLVNTKYIDCSETKTLFSHMDFLITMRIHAAILAGSSHVPSISVLPLQDLKSVGIMEDMSLGNYCLNLLRPDLALNVLPSKVEQLNENVDKVVNDMRDRIPKILSRAKKAATILKYFL